MGKTNFSVITTEIPTQFDLSSLSDYDKPQIYFDSEWDTSSNEDDNIRKFENVLSFQMVLVFKCHTKLITVTRNPSDEVFIFADMLGIAIKYFREWGVHQKYVQSNKQKVKAYSLMIGTYFGGVDISIFSDWIKVLQPIIRKSESNNQDSPIIALRKNAVFTGNHLITKYTDRNRNQTNVALNLRDMCLLAPAKSNLAELGDTVGVPKLNTEEWDQEDGLPKGYYKSHMHDLLMNRPTDYVEYANTDAIITALYAAFVFRTFDKIPATLGGMAASLTIEKMKHDLSGDLAVMNEANSRFVPDNPEILALGYYFDSNQGHGSHMKSADKRLPSKIDYGFIRNFEAARNAYFGGLNMAYYTGVFPPNKYYYDIDLKGAYNVGGHVIPKFFSGIRSVGYNTYHDFYGPEVSVDEVIAYMKQVNGPYTVGTCNCIEVKFPDNSKLVPIPSRANAKEGPRYKLISTNCTMTLTDLWTAVQAGAQIRLDGALVLEQSKLDGSLENMHWASSIQDMCMEKREEASKKLGKHSAEAMLWKELGNSVYGKTGQGLNEKKARDFESYDSKLIPFSSITDPMLAAQYTSITRYHITILLKAIDSAVKQPYKHLNTVTDGVLIMSDAPIDQEMLKLQMIRLADPRYRSATFRYFNNVWFEFKKESHERVMNLRTRFYGSQDNILEALASVNGSSASNILELLDKHSTVYKNQQRRMNGVIDMKHNEKSQHLLETEEQPVQIHLNYDWTHQLVDFVPVGELGYFTTAPFRSFLEHDKYQMLAKPLADNYFIYTSLSAAAFFLTMNNFQNGFIKPPRKNIDYTTPTYNIRNWIMYKILDNDEYVFSTSDFEKLNQIFENICTHKTIQNQLAKARKLATNGKLTVDSINWLAALEIEKNVNSNKKALPIRKYLFSVQILDTFLLRYAA